MAKIVPQFAVVDTVLASAVANSATFDVGYPTGFSQASFQSGLVASGLQMTVNSNDKYSGAQLSASFGASTITVTNSTGATLPAGAKIKLQFNVQAGNNTELICVPIDLASITGTQDVLTTLQLGFIGTIEDVKFRVNKPVTTAAKLATLGLTVNAAAVTGGVVALTSANATPMGKIIQGSAVTALNAFGAADTISVKASAVTAFAEGTGELLIRVRKAQNNNY